MQTTRTDLSRDEAAVVAEAKAGSYAAFEELMNRYERRIYRLGLNITGSHEDAEDVLQETFLKVFEHIADFREDSGFYTWIFRIGLNMSLIELRRRRSDKAIPLEGAVGEQEESMPWDYADWRPNPEQLMARSELENILLKALQSLPLSS